MNRQTKIDKHEYSKFSRLYSSDLHTPYYTEYFKDKAFYEWYKKKYFQSNITNTLIPNLSMTDLPRPKKSANNKIIKMMGFDAQHIARPTSTQRRHKR